jgi:hypothetical protein
MNYYLVSDTFISSQDADFSDMSEIHKIVLRSDTQIKPIKTTNYMPQTNYISDDPVNISDNSINTSDNPINTSDNPINKSKEQKTTLGTESIYFIKDILISAIDFDDKQVKGNDLIDLITQIEFYHGGCRLTRLSHCIIKCINADNNIQIESELNLALYLDVKQLKLKFDIFFTEILLNLYGMKKIKHMNINISLGEFPPILKYNILHFNNMINIKSFDEIGDTLKGNQMNTINLIFNGDFDHIYIYSCDSVINMNDIHIRYIGYEIDFIIKKLDANGKIWKIIFPTTFSSLESFLLCIKTQSDSRISVSIHNDKQIALELYFNDTKYGYKPLHQKFHQNKN